MENPDNSEETIESLPNNIDAVMAAMIEEPEVVYDGMPIIDPAVNTDTWMIDEAPVWDTTVEGISDGEPIKEENVFGRRSRRRRSVGIRKTRKSRRRVSRRRRRSRKSRRRVSRR